METIIQHIRVESLLPVYGQERGSAIVKYIQAFLPYASNFQPIVGTVSEQRLAGIGGQPLLSLTCPLLVQCKDAQNTVLVVKVLFPIQFPERAPFVALTLPSNAQFKPDHSVVGQHGVIRLGMLPLLQNGPLPPYSLCDVLLAITDALGNEYPFVLDSHVSGSATAPAEASPVAASAPPQSPVAKAPQKPPPRPREMAAAKSLMLHLGNHDVEDFLTVQLEASNALEALGADRSALQAVLAALTSESAQTVTLQERTGELRSLMDSLKESMSEDALKSALANPDKLLTTTDDASSAALQLLSEIHAYDDAMLLEEQLLRKGIVQAEDYVKKVSDYARAQFRSRFRFGRLLKAVGSTNATLPIPPSEHLPRTATASLAASSSTKPLPSPTSQQPAGNAAELPEAEALPLLLSEFGQVLDPSIIEDVWGATRSLPTARSELRSIAGLPQ